MLPSQRIPYRKHTHARATVTNVVHPDGRVFGAYASGVPGIVKHGGRKFTQIEKAATNYLDVDPLDLTAWTKVNGTETTAKNVVAGPRGDVTASSLTFAADATDGAKGQISTIANSAKCCGSLWAKTASGTQTFRIAVLKKDGNVAISADKTATTTWQRFYYYLSDVLTGATVPEMRIVNGSAGAAGTIYVWCPQAEVAAYPSSPITTAKGTRNKDENYIAAASMPSNARSKFTLHISPDHASTDLAAADERDLFDADDDLCHVKGYVLNGAIGVKGVADILAAAASSLTFLAADNTNIYCCDYNAKKIRTVAKGGGVFTDVITSTNGGRGIALTATQVVWCAQADAKVNIALKTGVGGLTTLAASETDCYGLALDSTNAYFTRATATTGSVRGVPLAGGAAWNIGTSQNAPYGIAIDNTYAYWTTGGGNIMRARLDGSEAGAETVLVSGENACRGIVLVGTVLFWCERGDNKIRKCNTDGTGVADVASVTAAQWIYSDGTYLWISNLATPVVITRVTIADGTAITITTAASGSGAGIVADSSNVYYVAAGGAQLEKIYGYPVASGAHTWSAKPSTPPSITFDAANKQIVTANFDSGSGTTTGSGAYTTTGGNVYIGEDAAGANQFDGLISEVEIG